MKLFSLLALSLSLLVGCSTVKETAVETPRPVVAGELVSYRTIDSELCPLMAESYEPKLILMDALYGCLSEENTRHIVVEALSTFKTYYINEARDCDDQAIELVVQMRALFRRDTGNVPVASTFGIVGGALVGDIPELHYRNHGIVYHAMAVVRCKDGKWLLIEPQSKQICEFTGPIYEGSFDFILGIF